MLTTRTTLAALGLAIGLAPTPTLEGAIETPAPTQPVVVTDAAPSIQIRTDRHRDLAEWAVARYDEAGLELPALDLSIHNQLESCKGNNGLYRNTGDRIEIHVCAPWPSRIERALLHELGHAWADATLDGERRAAFLDLRDLNVWHGGQWEQQGFEHAAEILMWGLGEETFPLTSIADTDTETLTEAFRMLTGFDPVSAPPEPAPAATDRGGPTA
jgi:hypothetical protein